MRGSTRSRVVGGLSVIVMTAALGAACQGKYERLPAASAKDEAALVERYKALVAEAKGVQPAGALKLLHHFSDAALSGISPEAFRGLAKGFIGQAAAGAYDAVDFRGAREPSKVRLLLVTVGGQKGAVPFVQTGLGWKIDDVAIGLGDLTKEPNLKGSMPVTPASALVSVVVLQDPQAGSLDKVRAALELAAAKDGAAAEPFLKGESSPWVRAALRFAQWKGGGDCAGFGRAFPVAGDVQAELYDDDSDAFRQLLGGLTECAGTTGQADLVLKVYRGCHAVEGGARSEYVEPVVALANLKPDLILQAALKAGYPYEEDPVANIVVGALHGEADSPFIQHLMEAASKRGKIADLAKSWMEKIAERDKLEPPPGAEGAGGAGE